MASKQNEGVVMQTVATNLLKYRQSAGLTQSEIARTAGVTVETVARLERSLRGRMSANGNPSLETLVRLANGLGIKVTDLFGEETDEKPSHRRDAEHRSWRLQEAARLEAEARRLRQAH
jgi:transcriptional regulator with XRE-family HTH domain